MPGARPVGDQLQPRTFENGSLEVEATICFGVVGPPIGRTCTPSGPFGKGGLLRLFEERTEMHGRVGRQLTNPHQLEIGYTHRW
jgi:hypothetical protein